MDLAERFSSVAHLATRWPSASSKLIPTGNDCRSFPWVPAPRPPVEHRDGNACGNRDGFLTNYETYCSSPDVAEDFAADASLQRAFASSHHPREVVRIAVPRPASTSGTSSTAEIDAATRTTDPLDPGDELLAVRPVLKNRRSVLTGAFPFGAFGWS